MSLPQKVEVLDGGMRIATVGRHYEVNEFSARKTKTRSREASSLWSVDCGNFFGPCVYGWKLRHRKGRLSVVLW